MTTLPCDNYSYLLAIWSGLCACKEKGGKDNYQSKYYFLSKFLKYVNNGTNILTIKSPDE